MPDVGVLNLEIRDNSEEASKGLQHLKTKLDNLKNTAEGYNLEGVATQIRGILDVAKFENKGISTSLKNVGTFLNSISALSKIKKLNIDTKPIEQLKAAIGDGFNIGAAGTQLNQMNDALNKKWNIENARDARDAMKAIASGIEILERANAKGLSSLVKNVSGLSEGMDKLGSVFAGRGGNAIGEGMKADVEKASDAIVDYQKIVNEYKDVQDKLTFKEPTGRLNVGEHIQQFAESVGGNWRDMMPVATEQVEQVEHIAENVSKAKTSFEDLRELVEIFSEMKMTTDNGLNLDIIISKLEQIKEVTSGGVGLASAANGIQKLNASAQDALANGTVSVLNDIATALGNIKSQSEGMNLQNVKITFGVGRSGGRTKADAVEETTAAISQVAESVNETFTEIETKVESTSSVVVETTEQIMGIANAIEAVGSAETALSTYVENFKPDWVFADQSYIDEYTAKIDKLREVWERLGPVAEDNMLSTHVESYSPNWVFADQQVLDDYIAKVNEMRAVWDQYGPVADDKTLSTNVESFTPDWVYADQEVFDAYIAKINEMKEAWEKYGPVAEENMLSTHVDFYNPDWVMIDENAITTAVKNDTEEALDVVDDFKRQVREGQEEWFNSDKWGAKSLDQTNAMAEKLSELDLLKAKLTEAQELYNRLVNDEGPGAAKTVKAGLVVRDLKDQIDEYLRSLEHIGLKQTNAMAEATTPLDLLKAKLTEAQELYNRLVNEEGGSPTSSKAVKAALDIQKLEEQIDEYLGKLREVESAENSMRPAETFSVEQTNALAESITELDLYKAKYADAQATVNELANTVGTSDAKFIQASIAMQQLGDRVSELEQESGSAQGVFRELLASMEETIIGAEGMRGAFKRLFPTLSGMLSRFKNIAKYRFLRAMLKQITSGAKEGIENIYRYSQIVGTSFAPAMDSAASALAQMKNSIGAALAPALQAIIPLVNSIVNAFINAINVVNQFFALISGNNAWTRALPQASKAFDDLKKSTKGAGKAAKDLLADWDELNIIQSQNGGGTGKEVPDYASMFEEVYEYDKNVQEIVDIIRNGFGDIWSFAKKIGAAVLAWKVSRAFSGFLGTLGRIAAGGVLIDIGLELNYGAGFNAGTKGYFDNVDILSAIGGTIASAVGGYIIAGTAGLVVGLTVGIVATLVGYIAGEANAADMVKWGNLHYSADQVKDFVTRQFSFDVTAQIEVLHANVTNLSNAKSEVEKKLAAFRQSVTNTKIRLTLGMDATAEGANVSGAVVDARNAIKAVQDQITITESVIEVDMKLHPLRDEEGKDISDDIIKKLKVADKTVYEYMEGIGKELADALLAGQEKGWSDGTDKAAIALMEAEQRIHDKAAAYSRNLKFDSSIQSSMDSVVKDGIFDKETAESVYKEQQKQLDEYIATSKEAAAASRDSLLDIAGYAKAAMDYELEINNGEKTQKYLELESAYNALVDTATKNYDNAIADMEKKVAETKETMKNMWIEAFKYVYGPDIADAIDLFMRQEEGQSISQKIGLNALFGIDSEDTFSKKFNQRVEAGMTADEIAQWMKEGLKFEGDWRSLFDAGVPDFVLNAVEEYGVGIADLTSEELRQTIMDRLLKAAGFSQEYRRIAVEVFKNIFGLDTFDDIKKYLPQNEVGAHIWDFLVEDVEDASKKESPKVVMEPDVVMDTPKVDMSELEGELDFWDLNDMVEIPLPTEFDVDDIIQALMRAYHSNELNTEELEKIIGKFNVPIDDIINFVNYSDLFDDDKIRQEILNALEGSQIDLGDVTGVNTTDPNYFAKKWIRSGQIIGSAGVSDVGNGGYRPNEGVTREENKADISSGVAAGTEALATTLSELLRVAQRINMKDFTVKIMPTSSLGRGVTAGLGALARVTGDNP